MGQRQTEGTDIYVFGGFTGTGEGCDWGEGRLRSMCVLVQPSRACFARRVYGQGGVGCSGREHLCASHLSVRPDVRAGQYAASGKTELFRYSTLSVEWTWLNAAAGVTGTSPSARSSHAMAVVGSDLYVFGGKIGGGKVCDRGWGEGRQRGVHGGSVSVEGCGWVGQ